MTTDSCLFCRIASRQLPSQIVEEDADAMAFADIHPQAPTHLLVVPKTHLTSAAELSPETAPLAARVLLMATRLAERLGLAKAGYRLVINTGPHGGQTVDHLHVHLLGGRPMRWPPG